MDAKDYKRLPSWLAALSVAGVIGAIGVFRFDMTTDVEFHPAPVLAVESILDRPWDRLVTVNLNGKTRILRTADRFITVTPGDPVCVKQSTMLIRRHKRYRLALPTFCRKSMVLKSTLAAEG